MGKRQETIRWPWRLRLTCWSCSRSQCRPAWLRCQAALSHANSNAGLSSALNLVQTQSHNSTVQGLTGRPRTRRSPPRTRARGIQLEVVKLSQAKQEFVLLPQRWVAERSFAWVARFRRLARDYERLPEMLAGLHCRAFAILLLRRFVELMA
jgi:hypothetical protein